jgi:CoA-binding protein
VRPGITSPSSVLFRDEEKILNAGRLMDIYLGEIQPSKLRLDQLYVRRHSFLLDLDVILWTFLVVTVPALRGHKPPEATLFWGPISRLSRRYISWFFLDAITAFIAIGLVGVYERLFIAPLDLGLPQAIVIAFAYSILFSSVAAVLGVQKISWTSASAGDVLELVAPTILALVTTLAVNYWLNFLPAQLILDATILAFLGFIFTRYRGRILTGVVSRWLTLRSDSLTLRERVLIVGAGDTGQFVAWRLKNSNESSSYQVIGFVDDDMFRQGVRLKGITVLGKRENIEELVKKHDIGVIIFAIYNISAPERASILRTCRSTNARVVAWPDIFNLIRTQNSKNKSAGSSMDETQVSNYGEEFLEPEELIRWLDVLEANLGQGDYASVTEQIHIMRTMLYEKQTEERAEA